VSKPRPNRLQVSTAGSRCYIDVAPVRGMDLTRHLRDHGVTCSPPNPSSNDIDCVEMDRGVDVKAIHHLLKGWAC
jgi:hypothetical protein